MAKRKPSHVLVVRLSALGDAAIAAPVVRAFAQANTDVRFTVAAPPLVEPLFEGIANVSFLGVAKRQRARDISRQLRAVGADAVADLHGILRVRLALLFLRYPLTISHIRKGRLSRWTMLHRHLLPAGILSDLPTTHNSLNARRQQWQRYADTLCRLGLAEGDLTHSQLNSTHSQLPTIGLAPFAQHAGKIWPWENTCTLALDLAEKGYSVLLFGSRDEATQLEQLALQHPNITSLAGKYSFREELEQIQKLSLMVSMDSANMHFASAVGTRVVSIWGATHPAFGFYGFGQQPADALCANLPCQPCSAYGNRPCRYHDYRCLRNVTPEQALQKIEKALQSCRASCSGNQT